MDKKEKKIYGIQGGPASFNEQAVMEYFEKNDIFDDQYEIKFLYTTEKVLEHLEKGDIDYGLFAIFNSIGGMVDESIEAMGMYKYEIEKRFQIKIRHFLMKRKDVDFNEINTIMAHPQVLLQCNHNLAEKHPNLAQKSGKGDLIDTATAGKALKDGILPKETAILGAKRISEVYNLDIVDEDLQDDLHDERLNHTDFLLVINNE